MVELGVEELEPHPLREALDDLPVLDVDGQLAEEECAVGVVLGVLLQLRVGRQKGAGDLGVDVGVDARLVEERDRVPGGGEAYEKKVLFARMHSCTCTIQRLLLSVQRLFSDYFFGIFEIYCFTIS